MTTEIKMPDLGDGIESGDILEVLVQEGDQIQKEQGLVEVETDKATVEIPSSEAGRVTKVHVKEGDTVKIGELLVSVESSTVKQAPTPEPESSAAAAPPPPPPEPPPAPQTPASTTPPAPSQPEPAPEPPPQSPAETTAPTAQDSAGADAPAGAAIAAGPAVRRFAREVGVDLSKVKGTGPKGRITREDVLGIVRQASKSASTDAGQATERDDWGPIRIEKMTKIRQTIARKMHESWETAPRVTNFDDADVTELERIRQSSKADYAAKGVKLTSMPFLIKAIAMALRNHPLLNATVDVEQRKIIYKEYVNIGIAVDTERGLVVPSLRDADKLPIPEIARRLAAMAESTREGKFQIEDLRGSTFTISNLGAIGGTYSTPIINVPEVSILLVGRARKMPVVDDQDQIAVRLMMPLSLSYDHRLVDGASAARFLNEVIGFLEAPSRLLLAP